MAAEREGQEEGAPEPRWKGFFDNWALLFVLSVVLSLVFYNAWNVIELLALPHR